MIPLNLWNELMEQAKESEFEIPTVPRTNRTPLWFRVGVDGDSLVVKESIIYHPSVKLSQDRKISFKDFESVSTFYLPWKNGEIGREQVTKVSQNSTYIFALLAEVLKKKHAVS